MKLNYTHLHHCATPTYNSSLATPPHCSATRIKHQCRWLLFLFPPSLILSPQQRETILVTYDPPSTLYCVFGIWLFIRDACPLPPPAVNHNTCMLLRNALLSAEIYKLSSFFLRAGTTRMNLGHLSISWTTEPYYLP